MTGPSAPVPRPARSDPGDRWGLARRRLYLCTPDRPDLARFVAGCIEGGVDVVQLRDKHLADRDLLVRAELVRSVCAARQVPFLLNDRPDLAATAGADGVHVGQDDVPVTEARTVVGTDALVGLSTHQLSEVERAVRSTLPVDYLSAGPVVPTPTKPGRPGTGMEFVRQAVAASPWPVWVTGGVEPASVPKLVDAGACHFVVVRWLTQAEDPPARARELRQVIDSSIASAEASGSPSAPR